MNYNPNEEDDNRELLYNDYFHRVAAGEDPDDADEDYADDYYDRNLDDDLEDAEEDERPSDLVELEFNKKNREDYEHLMKESSTSTDGYWDKNNPTIQTLLWILGGIIVLGVAYYTIAFFASR